MEPSPVDFERINEFTAGDPEQFKELTELYLTQTTEQLAGLKEAIAAGDVRKVEHLAHKCAGSSATCGMVLITPLLRTMEHKAHDGDISQASVAFPEIEAEFEKIKTCLASHQPGA